MKNPKTTISGILLAVVATANAVLFLIDGDPNTNPDFAGLAAAWAGAIGLFFARDSTPDAKP